MMELLQEETANLIINENPAILDAFPKTTEFALEKNMVPQFASGLTAMFLPIWAI